MTFAVGSLVNARGRDWIVLPESQDHQDLLVLRPLVGSDDEITGIYTPLEPVTTASFKLPDPSAELGNHRSCQLLRDAVRLGFRSAAGPFRALGGIAVEPRPYQLVPLLMALRLDPVRLLLADDVGVGKSIEAALILRELLDRAEIRSSTVLCPPHLAEQWHRLLNDFFHLDAALVLRSTAGRLERRIGTTERSLFEHFDHTVVSMDYIKMETRRHELVRAAPDLVIVDEAHTSAAAGGMARSAQQRHALLKELAADPNRHVILVTATPHSGKDEAFRSLLTLLDPEFAHLPEDLTGDVHRKHREHLARHFVQRRRGDLMGYLGTETPFPVRESAEHQYSLGDDYRKLFDRVHAYCREKVDTPDTDERRRRVRWWSALALLRALGSSPAAAVTSLKNRAQGLETETLEEADDIGRRIVLDLDEESTEGTDIVYGSLVEAPHPPSLPLAEGEGGVTRSPDAPPGSGEGAPPAERRRLHQLARDVEALQGTKHDLKLKKAVALVKKLLDEGFAPILFCKFIPTVDYVATEMRQKLGRTKSQRVTVQAITGRLPAEERERRVEELGEHDRRVLVCTDCLSEGINLQQSFDAVIHYDLSWNPTRHEQREGRVDRYGQKKPNVRTLTYYGDNNPIDGIVLNVLIRKHEEIRKKLGISVPVPMETESVQESILEGLLLRENAGISPDQLAFDFIEKHKSALDIEWNAQADREKKSRNLFAQHAMKIDDLVERELGAIRGVLGTPGTVESFVREALPTLGAFLSETKHHLAIELGEASRDLREYANHGTLLKAVFDPPPPADVEILTRTHPLVATLADRVWSDALDPHGTGLARRCGVVRTDAVKKRTTLLLLRVRYHILTRDRTGAKRPLLVEDVLSVAFSGSPDHAEWLPQDDVEPLYHAEPAGNIPPELARTQLRRILDGYAEHLRPHLDQVAKDHGAKLLDAHRRVRQVTQEGTRSLEVRHLEPTDVLGLFVYLPVPQGGGK